MLRKIISVYKIPLLISVTLAVVLLAQGVIRNPIDILSTIVGCLMGTFVLDSEYLLYSYFDPTIEFSKNVVAYINHKDYKSLIDFIEVNRYEVKDRSLNSVLFQAILAPICIFVAYASTSYFVKAFTLCVFANSIYRLVEAYFDDKTDDWFWAMKKKPSKEGVIFYVCALVLILIFCLYII